MILRYVIDMKQWQLEIRKVNDELILPTPINCVITVSRKGNPHTLKPFKQGYDPRRNTNGQPRRLQRLDEMLAAFTVGEWEGIIKALVFKAKKGDLRATELLLERCYGKARSANDYSDFDYDHFFDESE